VFSDTSIVSYNDQLRLTGGTGPFDGTPEVNLMGNWAKMCDKWITPVNAKVICRTLGLPV